MTTAEMSKATPASCNVLYNSLCDHFRLGGETTLGERMKQASTGVTDDLSFLEAEVSQSICDEAEAPATAKAKSGVINFFAAFLTLTVIACLVYAFAMTVIGSSKSTASDSSFSIGITDTNAADTEGQTVYGDFNNAFQVR